MVLSCGMLFAMLRLGRREARCLVRASLLDLRSLSGLLIVKFSSILIVSLKQLLDCDDLLDGLQEEVLLFPDPIFSLLNSLLCSDL